ncbi:MAG: GIY-YIG nuclease family protein [Promethearchaeota archaeon]|nr:MAG: GIY-YIG nuclease family protein [Candidatus Lokiarchaeota archaeon]
MKGFYLLVIFLEREIKLIIGALGKITFNRGFYVYIGSAMGSYGSSTLLNRVKRHLLDKNEKNFHWHIDYLLANKRSNVIKIYLIPSIFPLECLIALELSKICDKFIKDFGSSDCQCNSHLFYFKNIEDFEKKY